MTGGHHVLEEADTHRRETLDFVLSVQALETTKIRQPHNQPHMFRVPTNTLRHRIDRPEDTLPSSPQKIMKFSQTLRCLWIVTSTSIVLSLNGAWPELREQFFVELS